MILLPRGNPVKERIDPCRVHLPDALRKLGKSGFSGYLRFEAGSDTGILILARGKLISAMFETDHQQLVAFEAMARIFEESLGGNTLLDIYTLSPELALSIHALLHGAVLFQGQEVRLVDIKALLARLKEDRISGCLRIYTGERIALIFYRSGTPLGFFHDGSTEIETEADTSMSVARLPGAKMDVLTVREEDEADLADLLEGADLDALWKRSVELVQRLRRSRQEEASRNRELREQDLRLKLLAFLRGVAETYLGRIGPSLVDKAAEKELPASGGIGASDLSPFLDSLGQLAKLVAGPSTINRMLQRMTAGARELLKRSE